MIQAKKIEKEDIVHIRFSKTDVLTHISEIKQRDRDLEKALSLGNNDHVKVKLTFLNVDNDPFLIETTIWSVTEESICLKGDLLLPKRALLSVEC